MLGVGALGNIRGYIVISADGYFTERFLNICMHRGIFLYNVRRTGENSITAHMKTEDFKDIRAIASKTRTRVRVVKKCGLPFWLRRYRKRKAVPVGAAVFLIILWYLSTHITGIDITGNERISTESALNELKSFGVYMGAGIKKLDRRLIQNQMMARMDDIAWIGVNIKGSRVYIDIRERLDTVRSVDDDIPCNIVAARDGVVRLMEVKAGQSLVAVGSAVEKGELLVSGAVDSESEGIRYIHSFGEIYADTFYKKSGEYPLEYTEKIYTGAVKTRYRAEIMGIKLRFFWSERPPYENYDKTEEVRELRTPISYLPSLFIKSEKFAEYTPQKKTRTADETAALANSELCGALNTEIPSGAEIKNINMTKSENSPGILTVSVEYECRENIALQRPIDKIEILNYDIGRQKNDT